MSDINTDVSRTTKTSSLETGRATNLIKLAGRPTREDWRETSRPNDWRAISPKNWQGMVF
jgi:hypothetical protein